MHFRKVIALFVGILLFVYNATAQIPCSTTDYAILDVEPVKISCNKLNISLTGRARPGIQSYHWTTNDGLIVSDANTLFPFISGSGMYYFEVIGTNGCVGIDSVFVLNDPAKPVINITASAANFNCNTQQIQLDGSASINTGTFQWTTNDGFIVSGTNSAIATINQPGTYTLIATSFTGCVNSQQIIIGEDTPIINIATPPIFDCSVEELQLDASNSINAATYEWITSTGNIVSGANTSTPTINQPGIYQLRITSLSGCTTQSEVIIQGATVTPTAIIGDVKELSCAISEIQLNGSNSINATSYLWTTTGGNILSGATTATPIINAPGTYILTVTAANGCTHTASFLMAQDASQPQANAGAAQSLTCTTLQTQLNGNGSIDAATYQWTTFNGSIVSGANTVTPIVNAVGTYTLTIIGANGCTDAAQVSVTQNNTLPTVDAGITTTLTCTNAQIQLTATSSGATSYQWTTSNGSIVSGATTLTPIVGAAGTYTLTVTGASGCTATDVVSVFTDESLPIASIGTTDQLNCTNNQVTLNAVAFPNISSYQWTTLNGNIVSGANSSAAVINTAGTYILTTTGTNGCTAQTQTVVTQDNAIPVLTIDTPSSLNCANTQLQLVANFSANVQNFQWTTTNGNILSGANTPTPTITNAGTYTLVVTGTNGCTASRQIIIGEDFNRPIAVITSTGALTCTASQIQLNASQSVNAVSYQWTTTNGNIVFGANTVGPLINAAGIYMLTVTGNNGCTSTEQITILQDNALPVATIGTTPTLTCTIQSVQLNAANSTNSSSYQWSTTTGNIVSGSNTPTPTINAAGTYNLVVTGSNGCTATAQVSVQQDASTPTIQIASPPIIGCNNQQLNLDVSASIGAINYQWSTSNGFIVGGANTTSPTINAAGTYTLIASGGNGCTSQSQVTVTQNTNAPIVNIAAVGALTCTTTQLQLNGSGSIGAVAYQWTTSDGNFVFGENTNAPLINAAGTYTLTITAANGCTNSAQVTIQQDANLPIANISPPPSLTCNTQQVQLNAGNSTGVFSYQWTTTNGFIITGANTPTPIVSTAGVYNLLVTASNGCTSSAQVTVQQDANAPNIQIAPPAAIGCNNSQVVLDASASTGATNYQWTTSNGLILSGANTANPTINAAGTYILVASNVNGCTSQSQVIVTQDTNAPIANIAAAGNLACTTAQIQLNGSGSTGVVTYQWTTTNGNIVFGGNTNAPLINAAGTYILTVTGSNGCTDTERITIQQDANVPIANIAAAGNLACANPQIQLNGSGSIGAVTYQWTTTNGNIIFGDNTNAPLIDAAGTYMLTVTGSNGCTDTEQITIQQDANVPIANIAAVGNLACGNPQIQLNGSGSTGAVAYQWTTTNGNIVFGENTVGPFIGAAGIYTLVVTGSNGCTSSAQITVTEDANQPTAIISATDILDCSTQQVQLNGIESIGAVSYNWTTADGVIVFGENTVGPFIGASGLYTLVVTGSNGCTDTDQIIILQDTDLPIASISPPPLLACNTQSIQLNATSSSNVSSYQWSTTNGNIVFGADTPLPAINTVGVYNLLVTGSNGCTSSAQITVQQDASAPSIQIATPQAIACGNSQITLDASASIGATSYQWSTSNGLIISGTTTPNPSIGAAGVYNLLVTGSNGCTSQSQITVTQDTNAPIANITTVGDLACANPQIQLNGSASIGAVTYQWTTTDGNIVFGENTNAPLISAAGTYLLTVTGSNGCTDTEQITIVQDTNAPIANITTVGDLSCSNLQIQLNGSASIGAVTYQWTTTDGNIVFGENTNAPLIGAAGTYLLTVTGSNGCTDTEQIIILQDANAPIANITTVGDLTCTNLQIQLNGSASIGAVTYQWTTTNGNIVFGENTNAPLISAAGTYLLTVTGSNGCTDTEQITILQDTNIPIPIINPNTGLNCTIAQVQLDASASTGAVAYQWTAVGGNIVSGADTPFPTVDQFGIYQLIVTSSTGCTSIGSTIVATDANVPTAAISQVTTTLSCTTTSIQLDASSSFNAINYQWATVDGNILDGINTPFPNINAPGTYTVLVGGNNGCTSTASVIITQDQNAPRIIIASPPIITCNQSTVTLDATNSIGGSTYLWTTTNGLILIGENSPVPVIGSAGIYTVVVTSANGCISTESVQVAANYEASFGTINESICTGNVLNIGGKLYDAPGFYVDTLKGQNQYGCDSIITINLSLYQSTANLNILLCAGENYVINGKAYMFTGSYSETLLGQGSNGCDSIVNFNIIAAPAAEVEITQFICQGDTYTIGNNRFDTPGLHTVALAGMAANGCDSIIYLNLQYSTTSLDIFVDADVLLISCDDTNPYPELQIINPENLANIEETETIISQDICGTLIERNWIATDICGNQLTAQQTITIQDFDAPVIVPLPDIVVEECGQEDFLTPPTVTDNCTNDVALQVNEVKSIVDSCTYQVYRTWTATDNCGNASTINRVITVIDNTAPVITFKTTAFDIYNHGDTLLFSCGSAPILDRSTAMAMDNCDANPRLEFIERIESFNKCGILMYCAWRGTDNCGNTNEIGFYFNITDEEAPVFNQYPHDITLATIAETPPAATIIATDNCTAHLQVEFEEIIEDTDCHHRIVRSWRTADDCGNEEAYFQYINFPREQTSALCNGVDVRLRAGLQGATTVNTTLMRDDLRAQNLIPTIEPYTEYANFTHQLDGGGETVMPTVLAREGTDAVVDWIFIELRNAAYEVVSTRSALLQRNGDIVDVDGISPVHFSVASGSYYIAIKHRNHLGAMSAEPIYLTANNNEIIDFCSTEQKTYGEAAQIESSLGYVLRGGNTNADNQIIFSGIGNDRDPIFFDIFIAPENIDLSYNFVLEGYNPCDTNLDGKVIYQGRGNDIDQAIFFNVLLHPVNEAQHLHYIVKEQLPEE